MLPMKTLWKVLAVLVLVLSNTACEIGEDDVSYHFVTLQVVAVDMPEQFRLNETYQVGVTVLEANGCTDFEGFNITSEGTSVRQVVAIGTEQADVACPEIVTEAQVSFEFTCLYPDTYLFRFWTGENESGEPEFLEIEVPVEP